MPPRRFTGAERSTPKIVILMSLVLVIISITSVVLTSYPQHLYLDNKTVIGAQIGFEDNSTVNIRGNQVPYQPGDTISIEGKDTIRITGRQVQIGTTAYNEGIKTLSASLSQNVLFQTQIGAFSINQVAQVGIDGETVNIIPISTDVLNIRTTDSIYNIQLVQDTTYITSKNGAMLKIQKEGDWINIFLVGIKNYENIWLKVI